MSALPNLHNYLVAAGFTHAVAVAPQVRAERIDEEDSVRFVKVRFTAPASGAFEIEIGKMTHEAISYFEIRTEGDDGLDSLRIPADCSDIDGLIAALIDMRDLAKREGILTPAER